MGVCVDFLQPKYVPYLQVKPADFLECVIQETIKLDKCVKFSDCFILESICPLHLSIKWALGTFTALSIFDLSSNILRRHLIPFIPYDRVLLLEIGSGNNLAFCLYDIL